MTPSATSPAFTDRSIDLIRQKKSILCVGLDPQLHEMPPHLVEWVRKEYGDTYRAVGELFLAFNKAIIDAVHEYAVWVKPQIAFYEIYGQWGIWALEMTIAYARSKGLLVITDGKRGDGGDTVMAYAAGHLGTIPWWPDAEGKQTATLSPIRSDALTIHAHIGSACVLPFVLATRANGTAIFVVVKTSFKPDSEVEQIETVGGFRMWNKLAQLVGQWGAGDVGINGWSNVGVVMGATKDSADIMRMILPMAWFLVPGYGAQGGGADTAVVGANEDGFGITVNSSRGIIYAYKNPQFVVLRKPAEFYDFATSARAAAKFSRDELNAALLAAHKGKAFLAA